MIRIVMGRSLVTTFLELGPRYIDLDSLRSELAVKCQALLLKELSEAKFFTFYDVNTTLDVHALLCHSSPVSVKSLKWIILSFNFLILELIFPHKCIQYLCPILYQFLQIHPSYLQLVTFRDCISALGMSIS